MPRFWLAVAILTLLSGSLQFHSARQESQTWDEAMHLAAGFQYWRTGDFTRNWQHPPLAKLWAALPLLAMDVTLPEARTDEVVYGREFLFHNRTPHSRMLLAARAMMIAWSLALVIAMAWFTSRHFGNAAGLLAATLAALDPNFLSHGHYIATDAPNALFFFLTCALWLDYLWKGTRWAFYAAGVVLGLALAVKFSAIILPFVVIALYLIPRPGTRSLRHFIRSHAAIAVISAATLWIAYLPGHRRADSRTFAETVPSDTAVGRTIRAVGEKLNLRPHPFLAGVDQVAEHNRSGHQAYLLGRVYEIGRWEYFPVAFAVKTPVAVLALAVLSLVFLRRDRRLVGLLLPFAAFFAFCASSRMNLGLRHLLPVYPFLYAMIGACVLARVARARLAIVAVALAFHAWEIARIHPHHLAFFNTAAGGPDAGPRYLVDSNLDWGQDFDNLANWVFEHHSNKVCLTYFGSTSWESQPLDVHPVPHSNDKAAIDNIDCIVAASVTPLMGLYSQPEELAWLRNRKPDAKIGWSIYVWDLRKNRPAP